MQHINIRANKQKTRVDCYSDARKCIKQSQIDQLNKKNHLAPKPEKSSSNK